MVKLFTFNPPTPASNGKYQTEESDNTSKFKVWGEDIVGKGFKMSFDGSDLQDADGTVESTAPSGYTIAGKTPIITFEMDFAGAKDYNLLTSKSADEAEASVHGRYIEFNIGVANSGDTDVIFTDGHLSLDKSKKLGLTVLDKNTKYTFNIKDVPLISSIGFHPMLFPATEFSFMYIRKYTRLLTMWDANLITSKAGTRYEAGDDIPIGRKVGDVKDTVSAKNATSWRCYQNWI